jgi:hypothetical protein
MNIELSGASPSRYRDRYAVPPYLQLAEQRHVHPVGTPVLVHVTILPR